MLVDALVDLVDMLVDLVDVLVDTTSASQGITITF